MKEKISYALAASFLTAAIVILVMVFGQNHPTVGQPASAQSAPTLQALFTSLNDRINSDSTFIFRIRVNGSTGPANVTLGQTGSLISDVGSDYFCAQKTAPAKTCYPFAEILAIGIPS